jgi:phosphoribosyl 1,2-cyclic phosphodiesterase
MGNVPVVLPGKAPPLSTYDDLQFLPLGIGDFFSRYYYSSSFVVLAGNSPILVDCPSPLRKMLHEASTRAGFDLPIEDINHVVLTHLHGDHANGLEEVAFYKRFLQGRKPVLYTIREVAQDLWEHR